MRHFLRQKLGRPFSLPSCMLACSDVSSLVCGAGEPHRFAPPDGAALRAGNLAVVTRGADADVASAAHAAEETNFLINHRTPPVTFLDTGAASSDGPPRSVASITAMTRKARGGYPGPSPCQRSPRATRLRQLVQEIGGHGLAWRRRPASSHSNAPPAANGVLTSTQGSGLRPDPGRLADHGSAAVAPRHRHGRAAIPQRRPQLGEVRASPALRRLLAAVWSVGTDAYLRGPLPPIPPGSPLFWPTTGSPQPVTGFQSPPRAPPRSTSIQMSRSCSLRLRYDDDILKIHGSEVGPSWAGEGQA